MRTTVVLIVGSLVSFLTLLMVALGLMSMKPEWFGKAAPAAANSTAAVTNQAPREATLPAGGSDSTRTEAGAATPDSSRPKVDTVLVAQLSSKAKRLESQVDSLKQQLHGGKPKVDTTAQQDWKSTAKLIESMSAEEACKILKEMTDPDVKQVLGKIKKRQAGKILAILDPARAAKLLR
jgi:flagellar motility protein MotE (MotC chaperone)